MIDDRALENLERLARSGRPEEVYEALRGIPLRDVGELLLEVPARFAALREALPRMPADEVQISWTGNAGAALLEQSLSFVDTVATAYPSLAGRPLEGAKILDYGCGWGRLIRLMYGFSGPDVIYGCDAWDSSLALCRAHGIRGNLARCEEVPREVPFPGVRFDLAYAFSVFTHLSERTAKAVTAVLRRCMEPHGLLVVTIRPIEYWDAHSQQQSVVDVTRMKQDHAARGFAFAPHNRPAIDGDVTYGDTSMSIEYIQKSWPGWSIAHHLRYPVDPYQEIVFLRPA